MKSAGRGRLALEERVRILARTAFEGVLLVDDARRYVCLNERAAELLGAPGHLIVGRRIDDFSPPDSDGVRVFWTALEREGELEGRGPVRRHDGSSGMVEYRARWEFAPSLHLFVLREVPTDAGNTASLSERERQVLQLAADGRSTHDIAAALVISPATVKTHFHRIYHKLGARDRVSAVATALRYGVIS